MYEELIKRLREHGEFLIVSDRMKAPPNVNVRNVFAEDYAQAADAIEALQKALDAVNDAHNEGYDVGYWAGRRDYEPKWIPVTERLPKTRESILGKKSSKVIVAFRFDDGTKGTDTAHTLNGEWAFEDHITVVVRTITHWMSLPEPPEET